MIQMCVLFGAQDVLELVTDGYIPVAEAATEDEKEGREIKGGEIRKLCSTSISVWMRMCLRRLQIL
jgi:hypothetical protein